jgi:TonB family protein
MPGVVPFAGKVVRADELTRVGGEAPAYPKAALDAGQEGTVVVRFSVSQNGDVHDLEVVCATMPGIFDEAALTAIRTWRYSIPGNRTARAQIDIIFRFREGDQTNGE